jgi:parallel beta-helix repeat protein
LTKNIFYFLILFVLLSPLPAIAGDEVAINKKIQASTGVVKLESKTYTIEKPIVMKSGVSLIGTGSTVLFLHDYTNNGMWVPMIGGTNIKNSRISYINFNMNCDRQTVPYADGYHNAIFMSGASGVEVDHCSFINGRGDGARFKFSSGIYIHDNKVSKLGHDGFYVVDCNGVRIINNKVTTRKNAGIRNWNSQNVLISKNTVDSQLDGYGGYPGIQIEYSKYIENPNVAISENILTTTWGPVVKLIAYSSGLSIKKGVAITRNQFLKCGQSTNIADTGGISVSGMKGYTITNNVGDGCRNAFLYVQSGGLGSTVKYNIITNTLPHVRRTQAGSGYGIANVGGTYFVVDSNCFYNNANGNTYKITAKNSDLKDPKTHKTSSGWIWSSSKWIYKI